MSHYKKGDFTRPPPSPGRSVLGRRQYSRRSKIAIISFVYSALAVDKEVLFHDALSILKQLKQDFFVHHFVHSWMFLRSPQKQLKNLVKEWNYDALCSIV
ncbi:hypothetical protein HYC85_027475 [Camellia sinensis]|uniref:Uncharacterized protein n=1 Tax=Camellia sinensis TaxID=4442 RepID=A0A7J7GAI8_CAMSI|nr:hypothetical protein HYC85_027475 [Camellia sinensis]